MTIKINKLKAFSRFILLFVCLSFSSVAFANEEVGMADVMRSNGKIYIVVAVCLTILVGLFLYVFMIDKKISKIEKEQ